MHTPMSNCLVDWPCGNPITTHNQANYSRFLPVFFCSKDFDFLQSKETATSLSTAIKDSLLLRFDPLINQPVLVESRTAEATTSSAAFPVTTTPRNGQQPSVYSPLPQSVEQAVGGTPSRILEEDELVDEQEDSLLEVFGVARSQQAVVGNSRLSVGDRASGQGRRNNCPISKLVDVTMSLVDVNNDSNLSVTATSGVDKEYSVISNNNNISSNHQNNISNSTNLSNINLEDLEYSKLRMSVDGGQAQHHNQSNGESKIRNERHGDMERKMKEMEEKEEVLLKRLSEKEKQIAKMGHIVEEYERSIAGLMKERSITKEEFEKRCLELETERNANYQHLSSLETTFSDLHVYV